MEPMSYEADPRVDEYIDALPEWQQEICREVRELVHDADPELVCLLGGGGGRIGAVGAVVRAVSAVIALVI
jgi:hypothetical protein